MLLLYFCFAWSVIPFLYFASFAFNSSHKAIILTIICFMFFGIICAVCVMIDVIFKVNDSKFLRFAIILRVLFPFFSFEERYITLSYNYLLSERTIAGIFYISTTYLIGSPDIYWMLGQGPVYFCFVLFIEYFQN